LRYLPLTETEEKEILNTCQVDSFEKLIEDIPQELILDKDLDLPPAKSELELENFFKHLAEKNIGASHTSFQGSGIYNHHSPRVIDQLCNRGEFLTAYTPYQAELSQGTLQSIFEFQSMITTLFQSEMSNASLYDGSTALVESVLMAARLDKKKRRKLLISEGCYQQSIEILKTYLAPLNIEIDVWNSEKETHKSTSSTLSESEIDSYFAIVMQSPNKWGVMEEWKILSNKALKADAISIAFVPHALSLGIFKAPGEFEIDLIAGEGQSLGLPPSFGGPLLGLFACKKKYLRQVPGRLVGMTKDAHMQDVFCVTLSTREQHIKRSRATSNICSNQSLMALRACMFLALMGPSGLQKLAKLARQKAFYAKEFFEQAKVDSVKILDQVFFNELCLLFKLEEKSKIEKFQSLAIEKKLIAGTLLSAPKNSDYDLALNLAFSEKHKNSHIETLSQCFAQAFNEEKI